MTYKIKWSDDAAKQLRKLDKKVQRDIIAYLKNKVITSNHPCDLGKPLKYDKYGLWRYRVSDIRVICQIQAQEMLILVLAVGHRKRVYL